MATIRTRFRGMFAISITLLLLFCSLSVWFWARYVIRHEASKFIRRDVGLVRDEIVWQPLFGAFELRAASGGNHAFTSVYWQVSDAAGRIIWKSDKWHGFTGKIPYADLSKPTPLFEIPVPSGKTTMLASASEVTVEKSSGRNAANMLKEFPPAVLEALARHKPGQTIIATELEFLDERLNYEVTVRNGDELTEVEMNEKGEIMMEEAHHTVPKSLPLKVKNTFLAQHPDAVIEKDQEGKEKFEWRATQGLLQFIVSGTTPVGQTVKETISSTGQLIPRSFPPDGQSLGQFRIIVGDEQRWRHGVLRELGWILAGVCGSGLIAAWFLSVWLADRALQPMGSIARKARMIDERRLSERLSGGQPDDEIGILVGAINGMLDRIESAFERQRRFARDASHELRGPLTGLISQLELARSQLPPEDRAGAHLDRALERGQRMRDLIDKLLLLARQESDQPIGLRDDIEVNEFLSNVVADFPDPLRERIRLRSMNGCRDGHFVHGNEELLHAMLRNIIDNALKYSGPGEPIEVASRQEDSSIRIEVSDHGPGIPAAAREQVFEPFVRLRQIPASDVEGAGLGLSIVKWIADLHHATLEIDSQAGQGTRFSVLLPESKEPDKAEPTNSYNI